MDGTASLSQQMISFFVAISTGFLIGLFFDVYRIVGMRIFPRLMARRIFDLFWWAAVTALVFYILLQLTWGQVRLYILLGQALGCAAYFSKFSHTVLPGIRWVTERAVRLLLLFLRLLSWPLKLLKKIVFLPLAFISLLIYKLLHQGKVITFLSGRIVRRLSLGFLKSIKAFFNQKIFHRNRRN